MKFKTWLDADHHDACSDAREWVGDMTATEAWAKCGRPDWMIWLALEASLLNDKYLRLFAADCAEHVLPIFEQKYPNDDRPRKAIQAARDFANGKILDAGDTVDAAKAARAATRAAARAVARDTMDAVCAAGWAAARDTMDAGGASGWAGGASVRAAACSTGWAAGWAAELQWQANKLREYLPTIPEIGKEE